MGMSGLLPNSKTIQELSDIFREMLRLILRFDAGDRNRVAFSWNSKGESVPVVKGNVCYVALTPVDDNYNRLRDIRYVDEGERDLVAYDEHTDVYEVHFVNYGPEAFESARAIRNGLFTDRVRRHLRLHDMALITDVPAVIRLPELHGADWANRADLKARFNVFVRLVDEMMTYERVRAEVVTEDGNRRGVEVSK